MVKGWSPSQELNVSPHSGLWLLVQFRRVRCWVYCPRRQYNSLVNLNWDCIYFLLNLPASQWSQYCIVCAAQFCSHIWNPTATCTQAVAAALTHLILSWYHLEVYSVLLFYPQFVKTKNVLQTFFKFILNISRKLYLI